MGCKRGSQVVTRRGDTRSKSAKQKPERPRPSRRSERWIRPAGSDPGPGSRRLDDTAGRIEGGLYTQIGRVQQDGVVRLDHRGVVAAGVAGVAATDILQHVLEGDDLAARGQLLPATLGAHLRAGGD